MILGRLTGQAVGFLDMLCAFAGYTKVTGAVKPELTEDLDFEFIRGSDIAYIILYIYIYDMYVIVCILIYLIVHVIVHVIHRVSWNSWHSFMEFHRVP